MKLLATLNFLIVLVSNREKLSDSVSTNSCSDSILFVISGGSIAVVDTRCACWLENKCVNFQWKLMDCVVTQLDCLTTQLDCVTTQFDRVKIAF